MQHAGSERREVGNDDAQNSKGRQTLVVIVALLATTAVGVAAALAGYLPFGGYDRGGYEYSALFGYVPIGGYERGGHEYSQ
jgi:hypothetical protein